MSGQESDSATLRYETVGGISVLSDSLKVQMRNLHNRSSDLNLEL